MTQETTTDKQTLANQENAQKSTGPKTPEGKAIARYNALKHGLLSKEVLLHDEDAKDLDMLGKRLRAELAPQTELELVLVDRITANTWRLRRVLQIEREMIDDDRKSSFGGKTLGSSVSYDFANHDTYGKLIRYENSIERGIYKALHELQRIQAARAGEKPPVPVAIDLDISGKE